jgi:hypothetical protein
VTTDNRLQSSDGAHCRSERSHDWEEYGGAAFHRVQSTLVNHQEATMKKKKLGEFKLAIKTERLRDLSAGELKNVVGGACKRGPSGPCFNAASVKPPEDKA